MVQLTKCFWDIYKGNNGNFGVKFHNQFGAKTTGSMIIHREAYTITFAIKRKHDKWFTKLILLVK